MKGRGACCSDGLVDAAGICEQLGVPHHVLDARHTFQQEVVDVLVEGYGQGITPLPCSRCNRHVKMALLLHWAQREMGITHLATGHYARLRRHPGQWPAWNCCGGGTAARIKAISSMTCSRSSWSTWCFPWGSCGRRKPVLKPNAMACARQPSRKARTSAWWSTTGPWRLFWRPTCRHGPGRSVLTDGTVVGSHGGVQALHHWPAPRSGGGVA